MRSLRFQAALVLLLLSLAGCGSVRPAANTQEDSGSPATPDTRTSAASSPTSTELPADTGTRTPTSTDSPLPVVTKATVAHVKLAPGHEAVPGGYRPVASPILILSPALDAELISQLLAAYQEAVPEPGMAPVGGPQRWTLTFSLTDGTEVEVGPEGPGSDRVGVIVGAHPQDPTQYHAWVAHTPEFVALVGALTEPQTTDRPEVLPASRPPDFGFILGYGVGARYVVDTFAGTFTKDLVSGVPSIAIAEITFTPEDLGEFYRRFLAIGITDYPALFDPRSADPNTEMWQTPYSTYSLRLRVDGRYLAVTWADEHASQDPRAVALRALCQAIAQAMESRPEVKELPQANGGYA